MKTFSQRNGLENPPEPLPLRALSKELRLSIWNAFYISLERNKVQVPDIDWEELLKDFWDHILHEDLAKFNSREATIKIKQTLLEAPFNEVLNLIEFFINSLRVIFPCYYRGEHLFEYYKKIHQENSDYFYIEIKFCFEDYLAAYELLENNNDQIPQRIFMPRTTENENQAIKKALEDTSKEELVGSYSHLIKAVKCFRHQQNADSIRESIHAVEAMLSQILGESFKSMSAALDAFSKKVNIHPALLKGFKNLYGFTCDEGGIRHSSKDQELANVDSYDAQYFIGSCASFISFLINKHRQASD